MVILSPQDSRARFPQRAPSWLGERMLLGRAMTADPIAPVYAPIVRLADGVTVAREAIVESRAFAGAAEASRLRRRDVGGGDFRNLNCLRRLAAIRGAGGALHPEPLYLRLDLDAVDSACGDAEEMVRVLGEHERRPDTVVLEIAALLAGEAGTIQTIATYRRYGFGIAVDGVGITPESRRLMVRCHPDVIKLDEVLTAYVDDARVVKMIGEIRGVAAADGIEVIAQRVDTCRQVAALREMAIDYGQGLHMAMLTAG